MSGWYDSLLLALEADSLDTPWAKVAELRLSRDDYDCIASKFPMRPGPPALHSIKLTVDRFTPKGGAVFVDINGNIIPLPDVNPVLA